MKVYQIYNGCASEGPAVLYSTLGDAMNAYLEDVVGTHEDFIRGNWNWNPEGDGPNTWMIENYTTAIIEIDVL